MCKLRIVEHAALSATKLLLQLWACSALRWTSGIKQLHFHSYEVEHSRGPNVWQVSRYGIALLCYGGTLTSSEHEDSNGHNHTSMVWCIYNSRRFLFLNVNGFQGLQRKESSKLNKFIRCSLAR